MRKPFALLALALAIQAHAQSIPALAAQAHGRVGIACSLPGTPLRCAYNADEQLPMQSVYKLAIAVVALHQIEQGKLSLEQSVAIRPADIWSHTTHSPLRDELAHTHATTVPLQTLLRFAVEQSDNIACDMLIHLLGGAPAVERELARLGFPGIHIRSTEQQVDRDARLQYTNAASPRALLALLTSLAGSPGMEAGSPPAPTRIGQSALHRWRPGPAHTALLLGWMTTSPTGPDRIKGLLPAGTPVAHKTGTGDDPHFVNAINDVGLITLPDHRQLALVVLVADSHVPVAARERVIAEVARALYTEATH